MSKRPSPPARMVALLTVEKRRVLAERGEVTLSDFTAAWDVSWDTMIAEHAWPHATQHRRGWRLAMLATRSEVRAAWLEQPTAFAHAVDRLSEAAGAPLEPDRIPKVLLSLIEFVAVSDDVAH